MRSTGVFVVQEVIRVRIEAKNAGIMVLTICCAFIVGLLMKQATKLRKTSLQPFHFSALEVVESGHHLGVHVFDDGVFLDELGHALRVTAGVVVDAT